MNDDLVCLKIYTSSVRKKVVIELVDTADISLSVSLDLPDIDNIIQALTEFRQAQTVIN
jgi:hypothetical protein